MDTRSGRFPLVDSLRATAALAILAFHLAGYAGAFTVPVLSDLAVRLPVGVTLFFLISGFLLYRPFVAAHLLDGNNPHVGAYAWRRFLRIVPAYWAALTFLAIFIKPEVFDHVPLFYGFAQVYDPSESLGGLAVAWSLCVEISFYALLPLYALALRAAPARSRRDRYRLEIGGLVVLTVAGLGFRVWALEGGGHLLGSPLLTLPAFLDWFALGMGLALLTVWLQERDSELPRAVRWIDDWPGLAWALAGAAFCLSALAGAQFVEGSPRQNLSVHLLYGLTALALLAPAVVGRRERGWVRALMGNRLLVWLGLVSYGIYLWQGSVINRLGDWTGLGTPSFLDPNLLWLLVAPPVTVAVAALSYYLLERPALSLKRLVSPPGVSPDQPGAVSVPARAEAR